MNHSPTTLRLLLAMACSSLLLIGCQSPGAGTEATSSGPMDLTGTVQITDILHLPDSGVWRTNNSSRTESGQGKIGCVSKSATTYECSETFGVKAALGQDLLLQDLYAVGVNFATVTYSQPESQLLLVRKNVVVNALEDNLVRAFNASYKQVHTAGPPPTPADLLLYYAGRLLSGDTLSKKGLPKGLVADSVRKALVLAASNLNLPAKALVSKGLFELTDPSIHALVLVLVKEGKIADSSALYPLPAVRETEPVKVASDLVEGEGGVAVSGAFAWSTKGAIRTVDIKVKTATGLDSSVVANYAKMPDYSSGSWVLTGSVTIQAKRGAHLGVDTLIAYVFGDSGTDTSRTTFKVLAGDRTPPSLAIVQPDDGSDVPNSTEKVKVVVEAADAKGIAEVRIGNAVLTKSPYSAEVDLAVGFNFIYVQAKDNSGNLAFDTVIVRRAKSATSVDTTNPVVVLSAPRADTTALAGQPIFEFVWTATDNVGVQKVTLNGVEVAGTAGAYKSIVSLLDGANIYEIKAFDAAGNVGKKSATITRPADLSKPGIVSPLDQTVGAKDSTVKLTWKLTNSKKAVKALLNGVEVPVDSQIVRTVALVPGPNSFTLLVTDEAGAIYTGPVVVTRTLEVILPSIAPLPDRNVGVSDTATTLTWAITNSAKAISGTVNDQPVVVGATVSQTVSVNSGPNRFVLALQDATGKTVTDTVFVIRAADATGPVLAWVAPATKSLSVVTTVSSYLVQVKATDASGVDSVWIGGVGAKKEAGDIWSQTVALPKADGVPVVVLVRARDIYGNLTNDSVTITRAQGDVTPPVITLVSPKVDTSVMSGKTEIVIQAKATDAGSGVKSFTIAGADVLGTGTLTLGLKIGANPVLLIAADSAGNRDTVALVVTSIDNVPPVITLISPTGDQKVNALTTEMVIKAKATDAGSGVKTFTIGGVDVLATGEITVGLKPGLNSISLVASDTAGNQESIALNLTVEQYASIPVITPPGGEFVTEQSVYMESNTPGATIYYTTDGSIPDPKNGAFKYTASFIVSKSQDIVALAVADGYLSSVSGVANFSILTKAESPTFSPIAGSYFEVQSVSLKSKTAGAKIYYTVDGSVPRPGNGAQIYGDPITVGTSQTIRAIAVASGYANSDASSAAYKIQLTATSPTSNFPTGTYDNALVVKLESITPNASIYYTLDGAIPTEASAQFVGDSIEILKSSALKSIAVADGYLNSPVATFTYTLNSTGSITDARDGQVYKIVRVGHQWWMARNLNYKVDSSWWYKDNSDSGKKYGLYYNWAAGMALPQSCNDDFCTDQVKPKHRGVCPLNWHIPTYDETGDLGLVADASDLRATTDWMPDYGKLIEAKDSYGFNAFPTGVRWTDGSGVERFGLEAEWILTDEPSSTSEMKFGMRSGVSYVEHAYPQTGGKVRGVPIRCIKD